VLGILICRAEGAGACVGDAGSWVMTAFAASDQAVPTSDERVVHAATAAYLGRYRGQSRLHTGSDLKIYLTWCAGHDLDPLRVGRADIEQYVRRLEEIRCYQPSTVSRRLSVVVGFYRTCVIDQILPSSPADYVRRPPVPPSHPRSVSDTCNSKP
jgi:integrase/recombinase XerD